MVVKLRKCRKNGEIWLWRRNSERVNPNLAINTTIEQAGNLTIWGCFSFFGLGCLEMFESTMDAYHYVNSTLPKFLLPSVDLLNPTTEFGFSNKTMLHPIQPE